LLEIIDEVCDSVWSEKIGSVRIRRRSRTGRRPPLAASHAAPSGCLGPAHMTLKSGGEVVKF